MTVFMCVLGISEVQEEMIPDFMESLGSIAPSGSEDFSEGIEAEQKALMFGSNDHGLDNSSNPGAQKHDASSKKGSLRI